MTQRDKKQVHYQTLNHSIENIKISQLISHMVV